MAGRKTKYQDDFPKRVEEMARDGMIEVDIAKSLGIALSSFASYKNEYSEFLDALKRGKEVVDDKVVSSLYKRAMGYSCPETKPQWVQDKDGGHWEYAEMVKHYPPDSTSLVFWLKNRRPDDWRDKSHHEHSGELKVAQLTDDERAEKIAAIFDRARARRNGHASNGHATTGSEK